MDRRSFLALLAASSWASVGASCTKRRPAGADTPYDDDADAAADIDKALAASRSDGKRVLLVFGANWCPWCRALDHLFRNDPAIAHELADSYHLVHVSVGNKDSDTNQDIVAHYGNPTRLGVPVLVVLDTSGTVIHTQDSKPLESGKQHDPARVLAFLRQFAAARP